MQRIPFLPIIYPQCWKILYYVSMDKETEDFLREREEKLGAPIIFRTYALYYARLGGETRDYGVFLYSDGVTLALEDFERVPTLLGIPYRKRNAAKYEKLEVSIPVSGIMDIVKVTRSSAERSMRRGADSSRIPTAFGRVFRKCVSRIRMKDGGVYYLELMDQKGLESMIDKEKENGSI